YYLHIGSSVTYQYRTAGHNYAVWTLGWRIFEGSLNETAFGFSAPPLFNLPQLAKPISTILWCASLSAGLALAQRLPDRDKSFGILIYLTLLLNPVSWTYHIPMAIIPLWMTFAMLKERSFPRRETLVGVLLFTILSLPFSTILAIQQSLGRVDRSVYTGIRISFSVGMLSMLPAVALLGLGALLYHLTRFQDRCNEAQTTSPTNIPTRSPLSIFFQSKPSTPGRK